MGFGKMSTPIDIIETVQILDSDGFVSSTDTIIASVRAYREDRHGTKIWANRAAFTNASVLFRFRIIPGLNVTTKHMIICGGERFKITSVEDVRGKGMYIEALTELITPSKG